MEKKELQAFFDDLAFCELPVSWAARIIGVSKWSMIKYRDGISKPGLTASLRMKKLHKQALEPVLRPTIEEILSDD